jgi:effector-binding domain-containing protein
MSRKYIWWAVAGIGGAAALAAVLWGPIASQAERVRYRTVRRERDIEIRDYTPMIVAEVELSGDREQAIQQGFRTLADYIFGNNTAMRAIAMTAPVTQQGNPENWQVRFVMPARYTTDTLPKPIDPAVNLKHLESKRFAAIRFSGSAHDPGLRRYTERLEAFIRDNNLRSLSAPAYAFYNPPWTLPFLRRNEVLIEIAR